MIRNNSYKIEGDVLKLSFKLKIRWEGKQARLETIYDELSVNGTPINQQRSNIYVN